MKDLPGIRDLPHTVKEYPDENWTFVKEDIARDLTDLQCSKEAYFYEGARQLFLGDFQNTEAFNFFVSITDGYFPNYPFLLLPEKVRKEFLSSIRDPKSPYHVGQRFFSRPLAVKGHLRYALLPELVNHLEQVAFASAREMSEKYPGSRPDDFLPPWTQPEAAVEREHNKIMAQGDAGVDHSLCSFSVNVDFNYSDKEIVREFEKLIKSERAKYQQPVKRESRGKKKTMEQMFRDLAVLRLVEDKGGMPAAKRFLVDEAEIFDLFFSAKGWNGAVSSAQNELKHLRFCLGEGLP